jgi:hypothetical protein
MMYGSVEAITVPRRDGNRQRSLIAAAASLAICATIALLASSAQKVRDESQASDDV